MRGYHRRLVFESCEQRLLLTAACSADSSEPVPEVPAEMPVVEAPVVASAPVIVGAGPRVRPGTEVTRTVNDTGSTIEVRQNLPAPAVAPELVVAPSDPTAATPAPS